MDDGAPWDEGKSIGIHGSDGSQVMRIISGSARGKRLAALTGRTIRPTPDRVREALFSMIYSRLGNLEGKRVLDLFAGTGAMALEALSRGAERAVLVDSGRQSAAILPANVTTCGLDRQATFIRSDVQKALPRLADEGPFELVFLDPPYGRNLAPEIIAAVSDLGLLSADGLLCAETALQDDVPNHIGRLFRIEKRCYGTIAVHLFGHHEAEPGIP